MKRMCWKPAIPGQILTDAENHGIMLKIANLAGLGPAYCNQPLVKAAVEEAKIIEEEKIREKILCGGNNRS